MSDFRINPFQSTEQTGNIREAGVSSQGTQEKEQSSDISEVTSLKSDENDNVACEISNEDFSNFNFESFDDTGKNASESGTNAIDNAEQISPDSSYSNDILPKHK